MSTRRATSRRGKKTQRKHKKRETSKTATDSPPSISSTTHLSHDPKSMSEPSTPTNERSSSSKPPVDPGHTQSTASGHNSASLSTEVRTLFDIQEGGGDSDLSTSVYEPKLEDNEKVYNTMRRLVSMLSPENLQLLEALNDSSTDNPEGSAKNERTMQIDEPIAPDPTSKENLTLQTQLIEVDKTAETILISEPGSETPTSPINKPNRKERRMKEHHEKVTASAWGRMSSDERVANKSKRKAALEDLIKRGNSKPTSPPTKPTEETRSADTSPQKLSKGMPKEATSTPVKPRRDNADETGDDDALSTISHVIASSALQALEGRLLHVINETRDEYRQAMHELDNKLSFMSASLSVINAAQQEHAAKINDTAKPDPFRERKHTEEVSSASDSEPSLDSSDVETSESGSSVSLPSNIATDSQAESESVESFSSDTESDLGIGVGELPSKRENEKSRKKTKKGDKHPSHPKRQPKLRQFSNTDNARPSEAYISTVCGFEKEFLEYVKQNHPRYLEKAKLTKTKTERRMFLSKITRH
eukprot:GHVN01023797.1.p1 GENE.GHVN01023797.1~~GHVN01023797.1.p1  ORF type:complete len:533 (-),score=64.45 GHVN01023797.1:1024-2622(-)